MNGRSSLVSIFSDGYSIQIKFFEKNVKFLGLFLVFRVSKGRELKSCQRESRDGAGKEAEKRVVKET